MGSHFFESGHRRNFDRLASCRAIDSGYDRGISLTLPFSKTSAQPVIVSIAAQQDQLCPVVAFANYQRLAQAQPNWPLFIRSAGNNAAMGRQSFIERLRSWLSSIGVDNTEQFSGHSFRRRGMTALLLAGVSDTQVQRHGRWRSVTFRKYFDSEHSESARAGATEELAVQRHQPSAESTGLSAELVEQTGSSRQPRMSMLSTIVPLDRVWRHGTLSVQSLSQLNSTTVPLEGVWRHGIQPA